MIELRRLLSGPNARIVRNSPYTLLLFLAVCAVLIGHAILKYSPYRMAWDDLYFFHRTINFNRAVWRLDLGEWSATFSILMKSPLMVLMSIPWGPVTSEAAVGLSLVSLAVLTWLFAGLSVYLLWRLGCRQWLILVAALAVAVNPVLTSYAGTFLVDGLLSWIVLALLLLVPYEAATERHTGLDSVVRGLLWALPLNAGALAKVTFGYFAVLAAPYLLYLRLRRGGLRAALIAAASCAAVSLPTVGIWLFYGGQFLQHSRLSMKELAHFYSQPGLTLAGFMGYYARESGFAVHLQGALAVGAVAFLFVAWRRRFLLRFVPAIVPVGIVVGYFLIAASGSHRDLRFFFPVMVSLPFLLTLICGCGAEASRHRGQRTVFAMALVGVVAVSLPVVARPDLGNVRYAKDVLSRCLGENLFKFTIATDSPALNIETFLLARELMGPDGRYLVVSTLAYDAMHKRPLDHSFRVMETSDVVAFEEPTPRYPDFTNSRVGEYRSFISHRAVRLVGLSGDRMTLYRVKQP